MFAGHGVFSLWYDFPDGYYRGLFFLDLLCNIPRGALAAGEVLTFIIMLILPIFLPLCALTVMPMFVFWVWGKVGPSFEMYVNFVIDANTYEKKSLRMYTRTRSKLVAFYESYRFATRLF